METVARSSRLDFDDQASELARKARTGNDSIDLPAPPADINLP